MNERIVGAWGVGHVARLGANADAQVVKLMDSALYESRAQVLADREERMKMLLEGSILQRRTRKAFGFIDILPPHHGCT